MTVAVCEDDCRSNVSPLKPAARGPSWPTRDQKLAEEAVHLAAGMLLAGYRGVIATMWSIKDEDGPKVADEVYAELFKDGKADYTRAPYALHYAIQKLRSDGAPFLSWMPFIHMGKVRLHCQPSPVRQNYQRSDFILGSKCKLLI